MKHRFTRDTLQEHLKQEHDITPFNTYLREIVYGGNDGIVTTFAVVAGFAGAGGNDPTVMSVSMVLLFGFANLFADAASMTLGNYLSARAEADVYHTFRKREHHEIHTNTHLEEQETYDLLMMRGMTKEDAIAVTEVFKKYPKYWTDYMMHNELGMCDPADENPIYSSLATFFSFTFFGFIPLVPYILFQNTQPFSISILFTALALITLGVLRWKVTQRSFFRSVGEILFIGGTAASIAYLVGTFF